jgi:hypothetical protein
LHDKRSAVRPDGSTIDVCWAAGARSSSRRWMRAIALRRSDLIRIGVGAIWVFVPIAAHLVGGGES